MTYEQAYTEGFCKAAEVLGVDPMALVKRAGVLDTLVGSGKAPGYTPGVLSKLLANEHLRRAALGATVSGTAAALASDRKKRLRNGLIAAGLGGLGTYGVSASGVLDNLVSPWRDVNEQFGKMVRHNTAREITRALRGPDKGSLHEKIRAEMDKAHNIDWGAAVGIRGRKTAEAVKTAGGEYARRNMVSETVGAMTLPTLVGLVTRSPTAMRATGGASALGLLGSLLTKTRSARDQTASDNTSHVLRNMLLPGAGTYNMAKRIGSTAGK